MEKDDIKKESSMWFAEQISGLGKSYSSEAERLSLWLLWSILVELRESKN